MRALALAATLAACGDNLPPPAELDAGVDADVDAAVKTCRLIVTGGGVGGGDCRIVIGTHGPHGYDPAQFYLTQPSDPAVGFHLQDYGVGFLEPPRARLTEADTAMMSFDAMFATTAAAWRASGGMVPTPLVGAFTLVYDPGNGSGPRPPETHGTLDVTLISDTAQPAHMHVTW